MQAPRLRMVSLQGSVVARNGGRPRAGREATMNADDIEAHKAEDEFLKYGDPAYPPLDRRGEWSGPLAGVRPERDWIFALWDSFSGLLWLTIVLVIGMVAVTGALIVWDAMLRAVFRVFVD